jgi:hypothetical protein
MKYKPVLVAIAALLMVFSSAVCFGAEKEAAASVFFPESQYEFSPVLDGTKVVHDFVIQNKGSATLTVERVKTG